MVTITVILLFWLYTFLNFWLLMIFNSYFWFLLLSLWNKTIFHLLNLSSDFDSYQYMANLVFMYSTHVLSLWDYFKQTPSIIIISSINTSVCVSKETKMKNKRNHFFKSSVCNLSRNIFNCNNTFPPFACYLFVEENGSLVLYDFCYSRFC